ncbi:MAG TPA: AarF/UbiB family protein [Gemmatimonadaceae bacterium]|nr:AarF/UbiB family protein [Gemmatimonadaceae bacterium]
MRAAVVFWRLLPFVIAFLRDRRRWIIAGRPRRLDPQAHQHRAERLTATVASLGPTFIKLAQVFAARADIVPEPYLTQFGTLTDAVPPLPPGAVEAVIAAEFEQPVTSLFERFDPQPLAAASLGQVHRAVVDGGDVVVKVLRPGVERVVAVDLDAAFRTLFLLNVLVPNHHTRAVTAIVREFARRIEEEMDFREEAHNAELIRANFADDPRIAIPAVLPSFTRRRVLVLEYMEGTRIDRLQSRIASGEIIVETLVATIIEMYVRMMLVHGLFHADPHPGNLLVAPDGRVVLLDFGMVVRVDAETRARLLQTAMAAVRQDVDGVIAGFYELGLLDPEVDRGTVRDAARALMTIAFTRDVKPRQIQRIVNDIMSTFYRWPITLPSELVYFGRAAALVEGLAIRYVPDFNGVQAATPVLHRMRPELMRAVMGGDSREVLRDWMAELSGVARELRDILRRAGRDELRVRAHPRDVIEMQQFISRHVRRLLLGMFAAVMAILGTLLYVAGHNVYVLAATLFLSFIFFVVIFFLPLHLLSNPFRGYRRWR